jgi:tetratricopeptide (TPR) repeat protein
LNKKSQISPEDFELIENYLDGSLDASTRVVVESRLNHDVDFRINFEDVQVLREGIQRAALRENMNVFHENLPEIQYSKLRTSPLYWAVAASISLLILAGIWWTKPLTSQQEKIFQSYYHTDPGLISTMSSGGDYEFDRGMVDFKVGDYSGAANRWDKLFIESPTSDTLNYFLGLSYLELEDLEKSKKLLSNVAETSGSYFNKDANWYLGLIMIKEGQYEAAIPYLKASGREESHALISKLVKEVE